VKKILPKLQSKCFIFLVAFLFAISASYVFEKEAFAAKKSAILVKILGNAQAKKGVNVELSGGSLTEPLTKTTKVAGLAKFKGLEKGTYTVTLTKEGYSFEPASKEVALTKGKTYTVKFRAKKAEVVAKVGMDNCLNCHKGEQYIDWLQGPHGNFNFFDTTFTNNDYEDFLSGSFTYPSDYVKFIGFPDEAFIEEELKLPEYAGKTKEYCLGCHGPFSTDNEKIAGLPLVDDSGDIDDSNKIQVARPVVGCENCHGGGANHINSPLTTPIPFKEPLASQCGQCHNSKFPEGHLTYHPEGKGGAGNPGIYDAYKVSPHSKSINDSVYANSAKTEVNALCSKCHTDEGGREFSDIDGDYTALVAAFEGEENLSDVNAVQCRTCHNAHNTEKLLEEATTDSSAQFNTCTNCHQLLDESGNKIIAFHDPTANTTTGSDDRIITKNHYDDPSTPTKFPEDEGKPRIEGYNVNKGSETACLNCHNPHNADIAINEQWAESGHGDLTGEAWTHYDWKATNRQSCQKCHTATGFANYVTDPVNYNAANNDFSYLTGAQNEVLYCNACHSDSAFTRRTISPVTFPSGLTADLGDDSNLCMVCHQGRASKKDVDDAIAVKEEGLSFTNIHYFAAAASFLGTDVQGGYEYSDKPGKTYAGKNTFSGHGGDKNTCIKCHLREDTPEDPDHHFLPEVKDCSECHSGIENFEDIRAGSTDYDGDGNTTEGLRGEIESLEEALLEDIKFYVTGVLNDTGIAYDPANYPYWFRDSDGDGIKDSAGNGVLDPGEDTNGNGILDSGEDTNAYKNFDAKLLKAAYNYQVTKKEPCGYIHNHKYIIQLLIDSIEDLGGNVSAYTRP